MPDTPPITDPASDLATARALAAEVRAERDALHALFAAGITDLEIGIALVKHRLTAAGTSDTPPDVAGIVKDLRAARPALFRSPTSAAPTRTHSATLAHASEQDPRAELARAAETARGRGDAGSLVNYLRLRRAAAD